MIDVSSVPRGVRDSSRSPPAARETPEIAHLRRGPIQQWFDRRDDPLASSSSRTSSREYAPLTAERLTAAHANSPACAAANFSNLLERKGGGGGRVSRQPLTRRRHEETSHRAPRRTTQTVCVHIWRVSSASHTASPRSYVTMRRGERPKPLYARTDDTSRQDLTRCVVTRRSNRRYRSRGERANGSHLGATALHLGQFAPYLPTRERATTTTAAPATAAATKTTTTRERRQRRWRRRKRRRRVSERRRRRRRR